MVPSDTSLEVVCPRRKKLSIKPVKDDMSENEVYSDDEAESDDSNDGNLGDSDNSEAEENESKFKGNPGWADVFQKILKTNKPKKKKTLVLSRAKKLSEVVPKALEESVTFEIDGKTEEVKKEPAVVDVKPVKKTEGKKHLSLRTKQTKDRGRERMLQKIATKGVVQLFNAVRQQQTELDKKLTEAGPLERKKEKVLKSIDKRAFLDVLMGETKSISVDTSKEAVKSEDTTKEKVWSVLRDDFTMGAKLKDWDKNAPEEEEDISSAEEMDSD